MINSTIINIFWSVSILVTSNPLVKARHSYNEKAHQEPRILNTMTNIITFIS